MSATMVDKTGILSCDLQDFIQALNLSLVLTGQF
jgi:hypothetical protein